MALVAPDPVLFSTVGLSPLTATNPVGTDHTVTAFAQAANNAPVPGVTITFRVLAGPNTGKTGTGTTGADGKTSFTYHDDGGAGTDTIQAFIGANLSSNQVLKIWGLACDINNDGKVSPADLLLIRARLNTVAGMPSPRRRVSKRLRHGPPHVARPHASGRSAMQPGATAATRSGSSRHRVLPQGGA